MKGQGSSHSKNRYDAEFKRESVRLSDSSGKTDHQIEQDLGLYQGAIGRWRKDFWQTQSMRFPAQAIRSLWRRRTASYVENWIS